MSNNSVPGCFGYHPNPIAPNNCIGCAWVALCKKVVAKERLQKLLELSLITTKIEKIKEQVRNGQ